MHSTNYDIKKIHPVHQQAFVDVLAMRAYSGMTDEQIKQIYDLYIRLNNKNKEKESNDE